MTSTTTAPIPTRSSSSTSATGTPATGTRSASVDVVQSATNRPALWRPGLLAALAAAVATTTAAAIASAVGVSFATAGSPIPLLGFTQLTAIFATVGVVLAVALRRWTRRPQRTFVRTTVALTALSLVPDATFGFDPVSAVVLMSLHLLAAVIVIPVIARRLPATR